MTLPDGRALSADPAHLEVGCTVWSKTHQDSQGYVGGVVYAIDPPDLPERHVHVIRYVRKSDGPNTTALAVDALDLQLTTFETRDAGIAANNLLAWLGTKDGRRYQGKAKWLAAAAQLSAIHDDAPLTPGAQARYQAAMQAHLNQGKPSD